MCHSQLAQRFYSFRERCGAMRTTIVFCSSHVKGRSRGTRASRVLGSRQPLYTATSAVHTSLIPHMSPVCHEAAVDSSSTSSLIRPLITDRELRVDYEIVNMPWRSPPPRAQREGDDRCTTDRSCTCMAPMHPRLTTNRSCTCTAPMQPRCTANRSCACMAPMHPRRTANRSCTCSIS